MTAIRISAISMRQRHLCLFSDLLSAATCPKRGGVPAIYFNAFIPAALLSYAADIKTFRRPALPSSRWRSAPFVNSSIVISMATGGPARICLGM